VFVVGKKANESVDGVNAAAVDGGAALWHGRFDVTPSEALMAYTESLSFDQRLWHDDIIGSRAHVTMLGTVGILSDTDTQSVLDALDTVHAEFEHGTFVFVDTDEDIHTAIERRVTQLAGDAGARLHTGRSRNDQVSTALRLWCKREVSRSAQYALRLVETLNMRADESDAHNPPVRLPGYTHLQRAQPVLLSHHLRAHGWAIMRDIERLHDALARLDVSPLGAGALAGTSLPIDPRVSAAHMGFSEVFENSLDAVSDRDFVAEILFVVALLGVHLSRIGEEWVLWTSEEFSFATLDDAFATGSSMLPQKKNADIAELARGKAGRLIGNLSGLLATLKGLPLSYNRDLQEDKEPLFDSIDNIQRALIAIDGMISSATFNVAAMQDAADQPAMGATDLAEWLVRKGRPFREAHAIVGAVVNESLKSTQTLIELVRAHPDLGDDAASLLTAGQGVALRTSPGAAGPAVSADQRVLYVQKLNKLKGLLK
jgi:argininosuccinate lyase